MSFRQQYREYLDLYVDIDNPPPFVPRVTETEWEVEEDIMKSLMKKKKKLELRLGMGTKNPYNQVLYNDIEKLAEKAQDFFLITINPKEEFWTGDKFNHLYNLALKLPNYKWVNEIYWFFEQRGETAEDMGKGVHIHFVLTKHKTERRRLIDNMTSCFGAVCGEPFVNTINVKNKKFEWLNDTLNEYLIEQKKDSEKINKVETDAVWRKEKNIEKKYFYDSSVGLTIDKRPTSYKSGQGGARHAPTGVRGVKSGTKRGEYKKKSKTKTRTTKSKIPTPEHIVDWKNENVILEF